MSQQFLTTNRSSVDADYYEAKALALAFAVVGRLVAEGFLQVDFTQEDWQLDYRHKVQAVAAEVHSFIVGGV